MDGHPVGLETEIGELSKTEGKYIVYLIGK
jgi:hypothetical protein